MQEDITITQPNAEPYRHANMVSLRFSFEGSRRACASRLMETLDFQQELLQAKQTLERLYPDRIVRKVEITSLQNGSFYYDEWPEALALFDRPDVPHEDLPADPDDSNDIFQDAS